MRKPIEMDRFSHPGQKLSRLTDAQHDVFAVWQLPALGISSAAARLRCRTGRTRRIHHGVYGVGSRRLTRFGRWMAAVLAHGPRAVLSHWAALALWGLRPYARRAVDVTVPARGRRSSDRIAVHNVRALDPRDCTRREGIPVTTVARTLLDVAEIARPQELRHALEAAERRELLDTREIDALIARSPGRRGVAALRAAIADLVGPSPWTRSELERRFLTLVREAGLPEPQCNVLVEGVLVDTVWPAARLIVELDGYGFHRGRAQFESDRRRDAALLLAGYRVIRLTARRLAEEPERVAAELWALVRAVA
jgi:very-short-patch-repair endonuclease/predicted transcriptional regulator of viral defense system